MTSDCCTEKHFPFHPKQKLTLRTSYPGRDEEDLAVFQEPDLLGQG